MNTHTRQLLLGLFLAVVAGTFTGCDAMNGGEEAAEDPAEDRAQAADSAGGSPAVEAMLDRVNGPTRTEAVTATSAFPWALAYVWHWNPTASSYIADSDYSYNAGGGPIEITRQSAGSYVVRFDGLDGRIDHATVQVTGYNAASTICRSRFPMLLEEGKVEVECWDTKTKRRADSEFTLLMKGLEATNHAYAYMNDRFELEDAASFNPEGEGIIVTRLSKGRYKVRFNGLTGSWATRSSVQVKAIHTLPAREPDHCKVEKTAGPTLEVYVRCFGGGGTAVDQTFNVMVALPHEHVGFAQVNHPSSGGPTTSRTHNPSGSGVSVSLLSTGWYEVLFPGIGTHLHNGGNVQITARGTGNKQCKVEAWVSPFGNDDLAVYVRCFGPSGALGNSPFYVHFSS